MNNNVSLDNKNSQKEIDRLNFENFLWICFIFVSLLNIKGNDTLIKYFQTRDIKYRKDADALYITSVSLSTSLYIYFVNRNYNFLKHAKEVNNNTNLEELRYLGSVFVLFGSGMIWYYQVNTSTLQGSPV